MTYLALYRQYRPQTFDQVQGQAPIVRTLQNQVITGHIAHAYLFCGSRGTGKTSTAKVLSRAINCLDPQDGNPCGHCEICRMSDAQLSADIVEIDAASNNGVDEIRELREKVRYAPGITKYKVYIIDEVHMLSAGAFNALLKTLEEPPAHAVFILATTELHKIPATILSRCQRFDFQQLDEGTMQAHLSEVLRQLGRDAQPQAVEQIVRAAEGGMRDALSLLDQCLMYAQGTLTVEQVYQAMGLVGGQSVTAFLENLQTGNIQGLLTLIEQVAQSGANLSVYVREVMQNLRDALVKPDCQHGALFAYALEVLSQTLEQMRYSPRPRIMLDAAAVRLCQPESAKTMAALQARVEQLERTIEALTNGTVKPVAQPPTAVAAPVQAAPAAPRPTPPPTEAPPPPQAPPPLEAPLPMVAPTPTEMQPATPEQPSRDAKTVFLEGMSQVNIGVSQALRLCLRIQLQEDVAMLVFAKRDAVFISALAQYHSDLCRIASEYYGRSVGVKLLTEDEAPAPAIDLQAMQQKAQALFGLEIKVED